MRHGKTTSDPVEAKSRHNRLPYSAESLIPLKKQKLINVVNTEEALPFDSNAIDTIQGAP